MFMQPNKPEEINVANDTKEQGADINTLKTEARAQQEVIFRLDVQIATLVGQRSVEKNKLRSLTGKIVTLQMRGGE